MSSTDQRVSPERLLFYIEVASSLLVLAYTIFVLYDDYSKPGQTQFCVARTCQRIARVFGGWGLAAEVEYHRIVEQERMI